MTFALKCIFYVPTGIMSAQYHKICFLLFFFFFFFFFCFVFFFLQGTCLGGVLDNNFGTIFLHFSIQTYVVGTH